MRTIITVGVAVSAVALALAGCSTTRHLTNSTASGLQQVLETEAVDRALQQLAWPNLSGRTVFVEVASPAEWGNQFYLREAVASRLAENGAVISEDYGHVDYVVRTLSGGIGTDQSDIFFGLPQIQSAIVPIALPEIALYKSEEQYGFAKAELVVTDNRTGGEIWHSGPTRGHTYSDSRKILFIGWYTTDTTRFQK